MSSSNECCMITKDVPRPQSREIDNDIYTICVYIYTPYTPNTQKQNPYQNDCPKMTQVRYSASASEASLSNEHVGFVLQTLPLRIAGYEFFCKLLLHLQRKCGQHFGVATLKEKARRNIVCLQTRQGIYLSICKRNRAPPEPTKCPIFGMNI